MGRPSVAVARCKWAVPQWRQLLVVYFTALVFVTSPQLTLANQKLAEQFEAGVLAYQNGLYDQAEALWLQVTNGPDAAQAAYNLAVLYESGHGLKGGVNNMLYWYKAAAEKGLAEAQYNYAGLNYAGQHMPKKIEQAIYWWSQAGNQGHQQAQYNLGVLLFEGQEVPRDLANAAQWFALAVGGGYHPAKEYLNKTMAALNKQKTAIQQSLSEQQWQQHETWLFHQDPQDYTLELYRGIDFTDAATFVQQSNVQSVAQYYMQDAKVVVVAGVFSTEHEAGEALSQLTDEIKQQLPKPRKMASVQADLRNN